jgi:branched-chain amino acid aminotransferase
MGPRTHAAWLGSTVFDGGARLRRLRARPRPAHGAGQRVGAALPPQALVSRTSGWAWPATAIKRFAPGAALYVRPMYWPDTGAVGGGVKFDPETTCWCLCLYEAPLPGARSLAITLSPFRRPTIETAPVDVKAGCLYPNNARALFEAAERGFDNCLLLDMLGNVAELANSNVFMVKDGVVMTPAPNGTFLDGITRQRTIQLLRDAGETVIETPPALRRLPGRRRDLLLRQRQDSPSSRPSPASTIATCSPARSSARRANSTSSELSRR